MTTTNLAVIIPLYNEEKTISTLLSRVLKRAEVVEIVVVDDGSTDNSVAIIEALHHPKIKLVRHLHNQGKGRAVINGIKVCKAPFIIIQDADLEYHPSDYKKLLKPLRNKEVDFMLGNRWHSKRGYLLSQIGNRYITFLTNLLFGCRIGDAYTCYKVGPSSLWKKLDLQSNSFEIEAEIVAKLAKNGYQLGEVFISYNPRTFKQGKKIKAKDVIKGMLKLLEIRFLK